MARIIRTYCTTGQYTEDGDWVPDTKRVWEDELDLEEHYAIQGVWKAEDVADAAVDALRDTGCEEYSSFPDWQPHGWYTRAPYIDPYSGAHEEQTAHLVGFSEEESRLVHSKMFGGGK